MKLGIFKTDFGRILKYQISRKSVQWKPSYNTDIKARTMAGNRELSLGIASVEIKSRIQDNKNKNAQNNNRTSGAVWLRSTVFDGEW
jgi:hypothetical protein